MKTIFCDVDGCLLVHKDNFLEGYAGPYRPDHSMFQNAVLKIPPPPKFGDPLPKARETLLDWWVKGYKIILTTGRPESEYNELKLHLTENGFYFHKLIMECGSQERVLINDVESFDTSNPLKAKAFNILRNKESIGDLHL